MTITKAHLVNALQLRMALPKNESCLLIESVLEIVKKTLEEGEEILITRFGKLRVMNKRARKGRNPWSGDSLRLDSRRVVTFSCSPVLKKRLNGEK